MLEHFEKWTMVCNADYLMFSVLEPHFHPLQSAKGSLTLSLTLCMRTDRTIQQSGTAQRSLIRFRYLESGFGVIFQSALPSSAVPMLMLGQIWKPPKSRILRSSPHPRVWYLTCFGVKCFGEALCWITEVTDWCNSPKIYLRTVGFPRLWSPRPVSSDHIYYCWARRQECWPFHCIAQWHRIYFA